MNQTLTYFKEITQYPRPSKKEEKIRNYLKGWAEKQGYRSETDTIGNLIVFVSAKNHSSAETIILQSHMDMVCVKKSEIEHDFTKDPIRTYEKDGWIHADGTTLGADDGIGMALSMAATHFESHPTLELVFTVDEEMGMSGVEKLDFSLLSGKKVINLDNEELGEICISSAGSRGIIASKKLERETGKHEPYMLSILGMRGGHSGVEIDKNRGNAIMVLLEMLCEYPENIEIYNLSGGIAPNTIPKESTAIIGISDLHNFQGFLEEKIKSAKQQYDCPDLDIRIEKTDAPIGAISSGREICREILSHTVGIRAMSQKIENLVETSINLGIIEIDHEDTLTLTYLLRSSNNQVLKEEFEKIQNQYIGCGYSVPTDHGHSGWEDDPESELVQIVQNAMQSVLGYEPKILAVHAALECGMMVSGLEKGAHALSIGPTVRHAHSADECVEIESIIRMESILEKILHTV